MRKLRTTPARRSSGLDEASGAPPFQRACSIELSEDKSGLEDAPREEVAAEVGPVSGSAFAGGAVLGGSIWHVARTPSPSSTCIWFPETSTMRPVTTSPSLCSARYSSRPVG